MTLPYYIICSNMRDCECPHLSIGVYTAANDLVEPVQDVVCPISAAEHHLWWGHTWHMQTPLENLAKGCVVVFRFYHCPFANFEARVETSWGFLKLNVDAIDSEVTILPFTGSNLEVEILISKRTRSIDIQSSLFSLLHG